MRPIILSAFAFSAVSLVSNSQQTKQPNIVYILADDLGYGDLSCYGQTHFSTPNIDKLAKDGIRFINHYSGSTVCAPTRAALMTGLHTGHAFIRGNSDNVLPAPAQTFPKMLQKEGYVTGMFGKWGLGNLSTVGAPMNHGFNEFFGYTDQGLAHRYYPVSMVDRDQSVLLAGNDWTQKTVYAPDTIQSRALKFIDDHKTNPFFLYCAYIIPHAELIAPEDSIFLRFKGKYPEKPFVGKDYIGAATITSGYCSQANPKAMFMAMVTRLDMYVGQIVKKLEENGLAENTIIMFSSDNGPHQEGGADPVFFNSSGGLRGIKRDIYEGGVRAPFIVKWPGKVLPGTTTTLHSAHWDIFPTVKELVNSNENYVGDGISMLPTLLNKGTQKEHNYLYWEFYEQSGRRGIRWGDWKLVQYNMASNPNTTWQLYNLKTDSAEKTNVAAANPDILSKLRNAIELEHVKSDKLSWSWENNASYNNVKIAVTDKNGLPVDNAKVTLQSNGSLITWAEGLALFSGVSNGTLLLTVGVNGKILSSKSITVNGQDLTIPLTLDFVSGFKPQSEFAFNCIYDKLLGAIRLKSSVPLVGCIVYNHAGKLVGHSNQTSNYLQIKTTVQNTHYLVVEATTTSGQKIVRQVLLGK